MKNPSELNYRRPFAFAIAVHLVLLLAFLFRFNFDDAAHTSSSPDIVQATLVTEMPTMQPVSAPASAQQPLVEQKPASLPQQESLPQEQSPKIEPQQPEKLEHIAETQTEAETALLLAETKRTEKAAIEQQRQLEKEQQQKLQAEIQQQLEKEQQQKKARIAKKRQKEIEQLLQQDLTASSVEKSNTRNARATTKANTSSSSIDNKEIDRYKSLIISAISHRWIVPENLKKGLECRLRVRVAPGGVVMSVRLIKLSGDAALDHSAQAAIYKASPLPVPENAGLFNEFREFNLTVRPEGILAE